eukprot:c23904_g1_i1 orf=920-2638(+)
MGSSAKDMDVEGGGSMSSGEHEEKVEIGHDPMSIEHKDRERDREKEKERTKLRERHRRAITSKILAGLRRYGNYNLPVRADINDVIKGLAREAGWTVEADGTTYRSRVPYPPVPWVRPLTGNSFSPITLSSPSLGQLPSLVTEYDVKPAELAQLKESLMSKAQFKSSQKEVAEPYPANSEGGVGISGSITNSKEVALDQVRHGLTSVLDQDFMETAYVPVYVVIPLTVFKERNKLADPSVLMESLKALKLAKVDGVMVECCWGLVERDIPQQYDWSGYRQLFDIVKESAMKLQLCMSFHEYKESDIIISLPTWVLDIGKENPDIFFTDQQGGKNIGCLTWGGDKERILEGRTALEVYYDFMRSFRQNFDNFFEDRTIVSVEIGLGDHGELQYPSHSKKNGWRYPGIGEFQCYDKYLQKNLKSAAVVRGHPEWGIAPLNAGHYNLFPQDAHFFCDGGDYDSYYGRFFLQWYSQVLIDHGERVLSLANLVFEGTDIVVKISGVHWWYKTASHAAELTAGFYNSSNRDGYTPISRMLAKNNAGLKLVFMEPDIIAQQESLLDVMASPEGLQWQEY